MQEHDRAVEAAIAHEEVAAQPRKEHRLIRWQLRQHGSQIIQIGRGIGPTRHPACPPRHMTRHGDSGLPLATQGWQVLSEVARFVHHHCSATAPTVSKSLVAVPPIEPAPMVSKTSPS